MNPFFRFKIPRRWRLHRRGHSSTTAHDTPKSHTMKSDTTKSDTTKSDTTKSDTTKSGTLPKGISETPKSEEPPAKTQSDIQSKKGNIPLEYFFGHSTDSLEEEEPQANAKRATEGITLPLEVCKILQSQLSNAQSDKIKIDALKVELKKARGNIRELEHSIQCIRWTFEDAMKEQRELRKRLENCQPPSPQSTDTTDGEISD